LFLIFVKFFFKLDKRTWTWPAGVWRDRERERQTEREREILEREREREREGRWCSDGERERENTERNRNCPGYNLYTYILYFKVMGRWVRGNCPARLPAQIGHMA